VFSIAIPCGSVVVRWSMIVEDQREQTFGRFLLRAVEDLVEFVLHHADAHADGQQPEDDHNRCER
jgi:hypothetical protein